MRTIKISESAIENLEQIANFLERKWSPKVKKEFLHALATAKKDIERFPFAYPFSETLGVRKFLVKNKTLLYYTVDESTITIVQAFDHRQNHQDKNKWK